VVRICRPDELSDELFAVLPAPPRLSEPYGRGLTNVGLSGRAHGRRGAASGTVCRTSGWSDCMRPLTSWPASEMSLVEPSRDT
jgi:hypothetical protein